MRGSGSTASELFERFVQDEEVSLHETRFHALADRCDASVFTKDFVARLMVGKYKSRFRDAPLLKDAISRHVYEEMIRVVQPATIIDLGTALGGSAMWFATQGSNLVGASCQTSVVTFDIQDRRSSECKSSSFSSSIRFVEGDICDHELVQKELNEMPHPWIVSEDCHVDSSLVMRSFHELMLPGDYIVFEDTHAANPDSPGQSAESEEYTCNAWSTNKYANVYETMLQYGEHYKIDSDFQDYYGYNGCTHVNSIFRKM